MEETAVMISAVLSTLALTSGRHGPRGVLHELRARLDLREGEPEDRIAWIARERGSEVAEKVASWLEVMARGQGTQGRARLMRTAAWLAKEAAAGADLGEREAIELGHYYLVEEPDLSGLTLGAVVSAAEKWHEAFYAQGGGQLVPPGETVYAWPDGWTVQRVVGPKNVMAEGRSMQNCLQRGGYGDDIASGRVELYSLRRPARWPDGPSQPVVTMARMASSGSFVEVKGRQNEPPAEQYHDRVLEFVTWRSGGRLPVSSYELMPVIAHLPRDDARIVVLLQDPEWAYCYAVNVDKAPRDDTRSAACKNPYMAYYYAKYVDRAPRDDTRRAVCENPGCAYLYAKDVDKAPRDDTRGAACRDPEFAYSYARFIDGAPRDDTRRVACQVPQWAYSYAKDVDKAPRDDTHGVASRSSWWGRRYAEFVDKILRDGARGAARQDPE